MSVNKVQFNPNLYIDVKDASKYGISDADIKNINTNGDNKITGLELKSYGAEKLPQLTNFFVQQTGNDKQISNNTDNPLYANNTFTSNNTQYRAPIVQNDTLANKLNYFA